MKRSDAVVKIAMNVAKQAVESGNHNVDLSWLSIIDLVDYITQEVGMLPLTGAWEPEDE